MVHKSTDYGNDMMENQCFFSFLHTQFSKKFQWKWLFQSVNSIPCKRNQKQFITHAWSVLLLNMTSNDVKMFKTLK